jgi:hypothetical protein
MWITSESQSKICGTPALLPFDRLETCTRRDIMGKLARAFGCGSRDRHRASELSPALTPFVRSLAMLAEFAGGRWA